MTSNPGDKPPLSLAYDGHLYAGGKYVEVEGQVFMAGQIYAQVLIPSRQTHPWPIIMVHGGGAPGTTYMGTADGREGWAQFFVRRGYGVYVVDTVGRGRSPYTPEVYGPTMRLSGDIYRRMFLEAANHALWPQARLHTQWPGKPEPGDPVFDNLMSAVPPAMRDFPLQQVFNRDALLALLDRTGPAILLAHSQSAAFAWAVADARPDLVKAILAVEPNGPPVMDVDVVGAPDWFGERPSDRIWGLGATPLTYDPPAAEASELRFVRGPRPDNPELTACWLQAEPARQLPRLQEMPILIVTSEAGYHAAYDHGSVAYLEQAGVRPSWMQLGEIGIHGNGHLMMQEKNSDEVAAAIADWLEATPSAR